MREVVAAVAFNYRGLRMFLQQCGRRLRWLVLDHALSVILVLMIVTVFSVIFVRSKGDLYQRGASLEQSIEGRP